MKPFLRLLLNILGKICKTICNTNMYICNYIVLTDQSLKSVYIVGHPPADTFARFSCACITVLMKSSQTYCGDILTTADVGMEHSQ